MNMCIRSEHAAFLQEVIGQYDMVLLQLEIPRKIKGIAASWAAEKHVPGMLNRGVLHGGGLGLPIKNALAFAHCAAGITVCRMGAQTRWKDTCLQDYNLVVL